MLASKVAIFRLYVGKGLVYWTMQVFGGFLIRTIHTFVHFKRESQSHCDTFLQCRVQKIDRTYKKITLTNNPILPHKIAIKALSEAFKPITLEKYEFKNRQNNITNWVFEHVQLINIPIQGTQSENVPAEKHLKVYHGQFRIRYKSSNL